MKLHEKEYIVLPEAWFLIKIAFRKTQAAISGMAWPPDVDSMSPKQLASFLEEIGMKDWEIEKFEKSEDKPKYHLEWLYRQKFNEADLAWRKCHDYTEGHGIFMHPPICVKLRNLNQMIWDAQYERYLKFVSDRIASKDDYTARDKLESTGKQLLEDIERDIRARIWGDRTSQGLMEATS
jgi:hypothetical protein